MVRADEPMTTTTAVEEYNIRGVRRRRVRYVRRLSSPCDSSSVEHSSPRRYSLKSLAIPRLFSLAEWS